MRDFSHLHCHTQYSLLDGAARIKSLIARTSDLGMNALAITDHGNLFGVPEFYTSARSAGVTPVIGCEFYVAPSGLSDRTDRTRYHQVLLAKNEEGYRNLIRLSSISYADGYYYKPRIDRATLREHATGLVATTCCLQGEVLQLLLKRDENAARKAFEDYLDIFGEDYYIEIQDHNLADQKKCNATLLRWADQYGVKIIATNDVHYVERDDAEAQDVLLCLQTGKELDDPNRMRFDNDQFYLKSPDDMEASLVELSGPLLATALENTREIVEKCTFEIPMGTLLMPHYPIPQEFNSDMDAYLRHLVFERAQSRYPGLPSHIVERLDYELQVIKTMGFAGYFLIVQDFTTAARNLGVSVGPGRGSAAGSAVAYSLGITNIDPLAFDLLFERFLNPERVSMPDIDIDFDDRGRGRVIDYVVQKYGRENVCQIITFGTMGAKTVIRDVARVLNIPLQEADRIAKMIPEGPKVSLESAMDDNPDFRALLKSDDPNIRKLLSYSKVLEGSARHTGVHAAGVIIAPGRVSDYVPVLVNKGKTPAEDVMTTQYDGKWVEDFGLLKMDFLGLKTLTVLDDALALIRATHNGLDVDLQKIPSDDPKTFQLFQRGDTVAVFQFESTGMREHLRNLKPTCLDDLIAMNALFRPGPMENIPTFIRRKQGKEEVEYPHPMLEPILKPTYGIPVYQEQVMQMAQVMGGYTLGGADLLRRAMGKKKKSEMDKHRSIFVEGAARKQVDEKTANAVFDLMAAFAGYGFNKSHAAAYSVVAYQTAYLKANYPPEFMAAAMTNEMGDTKKLAVVLEEARRLGIEMLPPCVNNSEARFTVENGKIRFGLGAIKGLGEGAIEAILKIRREKASFRTLFGFTQDLDMRAVNKKAIEALIRVGALDSLEGHRAQMFEAIDNAVQHAQRIQTDRLAGQNSLFGGTDAPGATLMEPNLPMVDPWPKSRLLKEERELIGVYVSGHPLEAFQAEAQAFATAELGDVDRLEKEALAFQENQPDRGGFKKNPIQKFCGILTDVQTRKTKNGKPMMTAMLEDFTGQGELVIFAAVIDKVIHHLKVDEIVLVTGETEVRGGSVKILVNDVMPMWKVREEMVHSVVLRINFDELAEADVKELKALCDANPGRCKLYFDVKDANFPTGVQRIRARKFVVDPSPELMQGLQRLLGHQAVGLE